MPGRRPATVHRTMTEPIDERELARLLASTARAHHAAFAQSDGFDPDWAIWYAGHLQALAWDRFGRFAARAELTYLLISAERAYKAADEAARGPWPDFYARHLLAELGGR